MVLCRKIYYAAYELVDREKKESTPIIELKGIELINEWRNAFVNYAQTGNAGVFCNVLTKEKVDNNLVEKLQIAAFYEQTHQLSKSVEAYTEFSNALKYYELPSVFRIFEKDFKQALAWTKNNTKWQKELKLAKNAFENKNYLMCTLYLYESLVLKYCSDQKNIFENFWTMNAAFNKKYNNDHEIENLKTIRNSLAHGEGKTQNDINNNGNIDMLKSEENLREFLNKIFKRFDE